MPGARRSTRRSSTNDPQTYTGDARKVEHTRTYEWIHPLSDILTALSDAGMTLDWLHEHEFLPYRLFPMMVPAESRVCSACRTASRAWRCRFR